MEPEPLVSLPSRVTPKKVIPQAPGKQKRDEAEGVGNLPINPDVGPGTESACVTKAYV